MTVPPKVGAHSRVYQELFIEFSTKRVAWTLARLYFASRQLPQTGIGHAASTLGSQKRFVLLDDGTYYCDAGCVRIWLHYSPPCVWRNLLLLT